MVALGSGWLHRSHCGLHPLGCFLTPTYLVLPLQLSHDILNVAFFDLQSNDPPAVIKDCSHNAERSVRLVILFLFYRTLRRCIVIHFVHNPSRAVLDDMPARQHGASDEVIRLCCPVVQSVPGMRLRSETSTAPNELAVGGRTHATYSWY